jgi:basic amino acid/polyamine antiporter, APA family
MNSDPAATAAPRRQLSLFDSTSIIVGIIIGSGFYETSPTVAQCVGGPWALAGVWTLGGLFALIGSVCYAELAIAYPDEGGDYVYLTRGYGRPVGFLFAWTQLWVVRPGAIGALALVFARYATHLVDLGSRSLVLYATGSVVLLAAINIVGVRQGKWTQNLLTSAKVLGLLVVFVLGLWLSTPEPAAAAEPSQPDFNLAVILVLFAYSGWNEMACVAAEVRDPQRNILRALVLGTLAVIAIYLALNAAFLHALGYDAFCRSSAVAAEVAQRAWGSWGAKGMSVLICISALGAMNGMTFTGSRVYFAMGQQHRLFAPLGRWSPRFGTPVWSLALEGAITSTMIMVLGSIYGSDGSAFARFVNFTGPLFWLGLGLSGLSLIVLRRRDPDTPRPFRVPFYPATPLAFVAGCGFMLYSSLAYAWSHQAWEAVWPLLVLAVGGAICLRETRRERTAAGRRNSPRSTAADR